MVLKINKSLLILIFSFLLPSSVLAEDLFIKSYGHSNFLIEGDGKSIILNPYKSVGCASNLKKAKFSGADFILASSRLADEGYNPSNLLMFVDPGSYKYNGILFHGVPIAHDRFGGRRFGMATVWSWTQSNLKIVHMTGAAGEINNPNKIKKVIKKCEILLLPFLTILRIASFMKLGDVIFLLESSFLIGILIIYLSEIFRRNNLSMKGSKSPFNTESKSFVSCLVRRSLTI